MLSPGYVPVSVDTRRNADENHICLRLETRPGTGADCLDDTAVTLSTAARRPSGNDLCNSPRCSIKTYQYGVVWVSLTVYKVVKPRRLAKSSTSSSSERSRPSLLLPSSSESSTTIVGSSTRVCKELTGSDAVTSVGEEDTDDRAE